MSEEAENLELYPKEVEYLIKISTGNEQFPMVVEEYIKNGGAFECAKSFFSVVGAKELINELKKL